MSGGLESPLEALVFNCGSGINLGLLVNHLWTWVAVVTAAVSFWVKTRPIKPDPNPNPPVPTIKINYNDEPAPNPVQPEQPDRTDEVPVERVTKGNKYYEAYYSECDLFSRKLSVFDEKEEGRDWVVVEEWRGSTAEMGWYRFQDRRVLDGSVVKLWDVNGGAAGCCARKMNWSGNYLTSFVQDCN